MAGRIVIRVIVIVFVSAMLPSVAIALGNNYIALFCNWNNLSIASMISGRCLKAASILMAMSAKIYPPNQTSSD